MRIRGLRARNGELRDIAAEIPDEYISFLVNCYSIRTIQARAGHQSLTTAPNRNLLHVVVAAVGHEHIAGRVHRHPIGISGKSGRIRGLRARNGDLRDIAAEIPDEYISFLVDCYSIRTIQARAGHQNLRPASNGDLLHVVVAAVGHEHITSRVHRHPIGILGESGRVGRLRPGETYGRLGVQHGRERRTQNRQREQQPRP